jgi:hypothetical protein
MTTSKREIISIRIIEHILTLVEVDCGLRSIVGPEHRYGYN